MHADWQLKEQCVSSMHADWLIMFCQSDLGDTLNCCSILHLFCARLHLVSPKLVCGGVDVALEYILKPSLMYLFAPSSSLVSHLCVLIG